MATAPSSKHHKPLHNFSLPFLKWGHTIQSNHHHSRRRYLHNPHRTTNQNDAVSPHESNRHLIDAADVSTTPDADVKPWNLRPRRLVIDHNNNNNNNNLDGNGNGNGNGGVGKSGRVLRTTAMEEENKVETVNNKKKKNKGLWIALSKEEIEEDIYAFTGSKPSRKPKKRSKTVQRQLDNLFPGLYLVGVSADSYRV